MAYFGIVSIKQLCVLYLLSVKSWFSHEGLIHKCIWGHISFPKWLGIAFKEKPHLHLTFLKSCVKEYSASHHQRSFFPFWTLVMQSLGSFVSSSYSFWMHTINQPFPKDLYRIASSLEEEQVWGLPFYFLEICDEFLYGSINVEDEILPPHTFTS